jgi:histidinol dehydrogenase
VTDPLRIEKLLEATSNEILQRRWPRAGKIYSDLAEYVRDIIEGIERQGDVALIEYTSKFDKVRLSPSSLRVTREEIESAYTQVDKEQVSAINFAKNRIEMLERNFLARTDSEYQSEGVKVRTRIVPIRSVGCYVPGGEAAYPSTVLMTAVPAKIAGVPRVIVCSPPRNNGEISPLTVVAANICGVDEMYKVGGAQAIAALAYGTETIRPVEKIVGPGNKYVLAAKALVSRDVPIDMPAGPSEIVILADGSADPRIIALDMLSQAEHGADAVAILVTNSETLAEAVAKEFENKTQSMPNRVSRTSLVLTCDSMEKAVGFVNEFAPEHLEVIAEDQSTIAEKITSAGLVLVGKYGSVAASDYCFGTNHVLPTGGYGHVFSGLSAINFVKRVNIVECSEEGLSKVRSSIETLARSEGLPNHGLAVRGRFDGKQ